MRAASRAAFGQLITQIDELLDVRHSEAQLDACFAACALRVDGGGDGGTKDGEALRVDLLAFLQEESTLDWFLHASHQGRHGRGKSKLLR